MNTPFEVIFNKPEIINGEQWYTPERKIVYDIAHDDEGMKFLIYNDGWMYYPASLFCELHKDSRERLKNLCRYYTKEIKPSIESRNIEKKYMKIVLLIGVALGVSLSNLLISLLAIL